MTTDNKALADECFRTADVWQERGGQSWENAAFILRIAATRIEALTREPSTPSAQAGEAFGYVRGGCFIRAENWTGQARPEGWTPVYTAPQPQGDASGQVSGGGEALYTADEVDEAMEVLRGRNGSTALVGEVLDQMEATLRAALSAPQARPDWIADLVRRQQPLGDDFAQATAAGLEDMLDGDPAPTADGGAVAVVCLTPDAYANGQMAELQVQWTGERRLQRGDNIYTRPTPAPDVARLVEVCDFLFGVGELEGRNFGDEPPHDIAGRRQPYWWREHLRQALAPFIAAQQEGDS